MSLDDLERRLYREQLKSAKKEKTKKIAGKKKIEENIPHDWKNAGDDVAIKKTVPRVSKKALIIGIGIIIISILGSSYIFISNFLNRGDKNISIEISSPSSVTRGVPFDVTVNAINQLDTILSDASFELNLPQGIIPFSSNGENIGRAVINKDIGDISGGDFAKKTFTVVPIGDINSVQKITASILYTGERKNRFEKRAEKEISIKNTAISFNFKKPDHVLGESQFEFTISYKNNSSFDFSELNIQIQYPPSFKFVSSDVSPTSLNNYWKISSGLKSGAEKKITVKGTYSGSGNSQLTFPVFASADYIGTEYKLATQNLSISVAPSPISLKITANNSEKYVARIGETLHYKIKYQNLSGVALSSVVIKATLLGKLFDISTINTTGNLDSISNTVTWNASQIPALKLLDPGASGEVEIGIKLKPTFPIDNYSEKNFYVQVKAQLDSPTVPYYLSTKRTNVKTSLETRIGGAMFLSSTGYYRDAVSGITNSGPFPPKVNKKTQYTIHWRIKNFATDVRDVRISAFLESGVKFTGVVGGNTNAPKYDERTGEITWNIDRVPAMKGIFTDPIEIIFQVDATPNITQVGKYMPIISKTTMEGVDDFTGVTLKTKDNSVTTRFPNDKTVGRDDGIVVP